MHFCSLCQKSICLFSLSCDFLLPLSKTCRRNGLRKCFPSALIWSSQNGMKYSEFFFQKSSFLAQSRGGQSIRRSIERSLLNFQDYLCIGSLKRLPFSLGLLQGIFPGLN